MRGLTDAERRTLLDLRDIAENFTPPDWMVPVLEQLLTRGLIIRSYNRGAGWYEEVDHISDRGRMALRADDAVRVSSLLTRAG